MNNVQTPSADEDQIIWFQVPEKQLSNVMIF